MSAAAVAPRIHRASMVKAIWYFIGEARPFPTSIKWARGDSSIVARRNRQTGADAWAPAVARSSRHGPAGSAPGCRPGRYQGSWSLVRRSFGSENPGVTLMRLGTCLTQPRQTDNRTLVRIVWPKLVVLSLLLQEAEVACTGATRCLRCHYRGWARCGALVVMATKATQSS